MKGGYPLYLLHTIMWRSCLSKHSRDPRWKGFSFPTREIAHLLENRNPPVTVAVGCGQRKQEHVSNRPMSELTGQPTTEWSHAYTSAFCTLLQIQPRSPPRGAARGRSCSSPSDPARRPRPRPRRSPSPGTPHWDLGDALRSPGIIMPGHDCVIVISPPGGGGGGGGMMRGSLYFCAKISPSPHVNGGLVATPKKHRLTGG